MLKKLASLGSDEILEKPVWSPDGRYLCVIHGNTEATEVLLIDLSTEKRMRLDKVEGKYSIALLVTGFQCTHLHGKPGFA